MESQKPRILGVHWWNKPACVAVAVAVAVAVVERPTWIDLPTCHSQTVVMESVNERSPNTTYFPAATSSTASAQTTQSANTHTSVENEMSAH